MLRKTNSHSMRLNVNFPAYHGRISAAEAKKRLLSEISDSSAGKYLVRLCGCRPPGDYVISYLTKKLTVKHLIIPRQKHGNLFQFNPQIKTLQDKVNFLKKQIRFITLSFGVSYLDFNNRDVLRAGIDGEDLNYCNICEQGFLDKRKSKEHKQQHKVIFCPHCGYITQYNSYNTHRRMCRDVKVKCEVCDFETNHRRSLKQHMKLHSENSGRVECQICVKTFTGQDKLESHMQSKHYFSYFCKICGKSFVTRQGKNSHNRIKHKMTYIIPGEMSKELNYESLEANVKFLPQKHKSLKDSNTKLERRRKSREKKITTESERLEKNKQMNKRRIEKRKRFKDKTEEEILFVAFK